MTDETTTESDTPETTTISAGAEYEIEQEAITELTQDVAVHAVVGPSEFRQALVASNPDSDEDGDLTALGYHRSELRSLPAARHAANRPDAPETITVTADTELTISETATEPVGPNHTRHRVVGDSEFDYAIVRKNPDTDDSTDRMAFGHHEDELPIRSGHRRQPAQSDTDNRPAPTVSQHTPDTNTATPDPQIIIDPDDEAHAQTIIDSLDLDESEITLTTSDRVVHLTDYQTAAVGLDFPALTECPDCGHTVLEAIANNRDKVTLGLDGEGGIAHREHEHPITELYSLLQCGECGTVLVEDAEIVHEALTT